MLGSAYRFATVTLLWKKYRRSKYLLPLLGTMALLYRWAQIFCRSRTRPRISSLAVISIGSVRSGGSGKTPMVRALARHLSAFWKLVVITRGYGSRVHSPRLLMGSEESIEVGDEAHMLSCSISDSVPSLPVIVAPKRWQGCELAASQGFQVALLDDGMQHYALHKNVEIGLIGPEDFQEQMLPLGRLREPLPHMARCDWILVRDVHLLDLQAQRHLNAWKRPWASFELYSPHLYDSSGTIIPWSELKDHSVIAFAGIADPERFFELLLCKGIHLLDHEPLGDHHVIDNKKLMLWVEFWAGKGAKALFCTEKDRARLPSTLLDELTHKIPLICPAWEVVWRENATQFFSDIENLLRKVIPCR